MQAGTVAFAADEALSGKLKLESQTTKAKALSHLEQLASDAMRDALEATTNSMQVPTNADNFGEMVINNRRSKRISTLDSID